jgi:preprotein translocase subunit SecE
MNRQHRGDATRRDGVGAGGPDPDSWADDDRRLADGGGDDLIGDRLDTEDATQESVRRAGSEALAPAEHRFAPRQFLHEVNVELRKVRWPSRTETLNYSAVVLIALVVITSLIFGLDLGFSKVAGFLFNP